MILDEINERYKRIMCKIDDEESVHIFNARVDYMITRDEKKLEETLYNGEKKYRCVELDGVIKLDEKRPIVIFGCGIYGELTKRNLERCEKRYNICAFCDNNASYIGGTIDGVPIVSVDNLKNMERCIIIIASRKHGREIYNQLITLGMNKDDILTPTLGYPEIQCGWQYFDMFSPKNNEIFVDAGAFDGQTILDYYKWLGERQGMCYGLEPVEEMYNRLGQMITEKRLKNTKIYNVAAWNQDESVNILLDQRVDGEIWGGSTISELGGECVQARSIDSILAENSRAVSYIKMDIEGSELKALEGARNSIRKYKPRLAISVYHKPMDILEIPNYILDLVEEYRFYLRHYSGNQNETILYAEI